MTSKLMIKRHANICHTLECNLYPALQQCQWSQCLIPGSVECQHMPAPTKERQKARQSGIKQKLEEVESEGPAEVTTSCQFGTIGESCNTLLMSANSSKACFATPMFQALSSSVFDHTYICVLSVRDLLCTCAHLAPMPFSSRSRSIKWEVPESGRVWELN